MKRVAILLTTIALSIGIAYAEGVVTSQNFHEMYNGGTMTVNTSTKTAVTDFVTYTYSGGIYSRFNYDGTLTGGKICLQLYGNGAKVITTSIQNLDSLAIHYYYPGDDDHQRLRVYTSDDGGGTWTAQTVVQKLNGSVKAVKMPAKGNYMLKIERWDDIWIEQIDYVTAPPCNCLRVIVTE